MSINYFGVLHTVKAVLPTMLQQHTGHIVFISSSMGLIGMLQVAASFGHAAPAVLNIVTVYL